VFLLLLFVHLYNVKKTNLSSLAVKLSGKDWVVSANNVWRYTPCGYL